MALYVHAILSRSCLSFAKKNVVNKIKINKYPFKNITIEKYIFINKWQAVWDSCFFDPFNLTFHKHGCEQLISRQTMKSLQNSLNVPGVFVVH